MDGCNGRRGQSIRGSWRRRRLIRFRPPSVAVSERGERIEERLQLVGNRELSGDGGRPRQLRNNAELDALDVDGLGGRRIDHRCKCGEEATTRVQRDHGGPLPALLASRQASPPPQERRPRCRHRIRRPPGYRGVVEADRPRACSHSSLPSLKSASKVRARRAMVIRSSRRIPSSRLRSSEAVVKFWEPT